MKFDKFDNGNHFSIGAELELRILNKDNLTCVNEYDYFKNNIDSKFKNNITSEFLQSMIEINTPVFFNLSDLINYFKQILEELNTLAKKKNLVLQSSGSSAIKQEHLDISSNPRYQELVNEHQILLDDFSICGLHVHIGLENFEKALNAYNFSLLYLPIFVALSASSSFSNGLNTGIHSYRTKIFDRLPKASIPQYFDSYEHMKEVYDILYKSGVINSEKDVWWDVRIQPNFKTIEFRVCDAINDFERLEVVAGLFKAICKLSQTKEIIYEPLQLLKQNMWKAARYSMDADFIYGVEKRLIRNVILELIKECKQKNIISEEFETKAINIANKNSIAQDMINIFSETKDLKKVDEIGVFK